ncbi:integrase core domain-containing protein [Streptomyces sp. NPDC001792]|uniref:integrase core domain-containing protein n=1 Tax=Streptomyces sp. NPDC001792 TaxID=3154524 RepID=UPI00331D7DC4
MVGGFAAAVAADEGHGGAAVALPVQVEAVADDQAERRRARGRRYPTLNQNTAIQFLDYVLQRLPFQVEVIQTDNGAEFQSAFHCHALDKGIAHTYIKPRTPRLNGKVDAEEFYRLLDDVIIDDAQVFNDKLREWEEYYNYHRPHGGLGGQTPCERFKQKSTAQA